MVLAEPSHQLQESQWLEMLVGDPPQARSDPSALGFPPSPSHSPCSCQPFLFPGSGQDSGEML